MQNPIALKISEVCAASRIGRTRVYEAIKRGELRARKNGKSTLVLYTDLVEWLDHLPVISPNQQCRIALRDKRARRNHIVGRSPSRA
jgi:excisionase family DNA binding protein